MTILLTGGAGFIGSHLAKRILEQGHKVIIADNFNNFYDPWLKKDRVKNLLGGFDYKLYEADITDFASLNRIFQDHKIDKIFHLAAQAGVTYSIKNPFAYHHTNTGGTLNIFELAKNYRVEQVVYASSASVYGGSTKLPSSETDQANTPLSIYAVSKIATENIAHCYNYLYGIPSTGLRYFNVYGPWGRPDSALFIFTQKIIAGEPIDLRNQGQMKRNFSYIDDIIDGSVAALDKIFKYEIINLGADRSEDLEKFVDLIEINLGKKALRNYVPMQPGEVLESRADLTKAKQLFGFAPKVHIEEGVKKFVEWYRGYYRND